jgi:DAPG hydrolase PhiG domain
LEAGCGLTEDNMYHIAASTYMHKCSAEMIDWWFGFIHTTDQYKLWHPRDHVFSDWEGPRENKSEYIGGHHLVHEYSGDELQKLKISFKAPAQYFGPGWKEEFAKAGYRTAICGRTGSWEPETGKVTYMGHLIHLIKNEPDGCRMRSRFWMGDVEGMPLAMGNMMPVSITSGLLKHATEEMAILATQLPQLYQQYGPSSQVKL